MQKKQQQELPTGQNIMPIILKSIPKEANINKIDYEGPRIAIYTKTPRYLLENTTIISNLVNVSLFGNTFQYYWHNILPCR